MQLDCRQFETLGAHRATESECVAGRTNYNRAIGSQNSGSFWIPSNSCNQHRGEEV
jgi:hypothetical protein